MLAVLLISAYFLGSIPSALIAVYIATGKDIRTMGSGNSGATNVYRLIGLKGALPVALFDFSKAFFPVFYCVKLAEVLGVGGLNGTILQFLLFLSVVVGHVFPVWAGFRGGKAVASAAGGVTALFPLAAPVCLTLFIVVARLSGYVSLASMATAWFLPLFYWLYSLLAGKTLTLHYLIFFLICAFLVTVLHRKNIIRLMKGEENGFGKKRL